MPTHRRVFGSVSANFYQFHFQLTVDQNTQTGSANHQQLSVWNARKELGPHKKFLPGQDTRNTRRHTHKHTHPQKTEGHTTTHKEISAEIQSFLPLSFFFLFSQESFSFISISMPAKLPSVLYYLFYFKRKERVCLVQTIPIPSLSLRKFSAKLRHAQFICK